ncbi:MAG: IS110 family transposase [Bacteroidetes bacterium]|nr:MAG: IS110 family transposase [Bacteroidota bacterium]
MDLVFPHSSGLDVHKRFVVACVYTPAGEYRTEHFETTTSALRDLVAWLQTMGVTHVAMESTGVYWKPVYNILHPHFEVWVVNARHLAQVPGRKTDESDAQWITRLMRYGLLSPSFIPEEWQRDLRDLTRYRTRLLQEQSRTANRLQQILEDANIKLGSVVSDIQGVSARAMLEALISGEKEASEMAQLAQKRLRQKIPQLVEALSGQVRAHHRYMLQEILEHLDELNRRIANLDAHIRELTAPYASILERLDAIPGVGQRTAEIVLAEIGSQVDKWPTPGHLASWACLCPGNRQSGGKRGSGKRRKGHKWLVSALIEAAWAASRSKNTYLSAQFHRIRARRGGKRAAVAVAHSIVRVIYHLLQDPEAVFVELGGDYFLKKNKEQERRRAVKRLEMLGYQVELTAAPVAS